MNNKPETLFINPPWYRLQGLLSTYPPMGACYMAAVLEKNGYKSAIWNADYTDRDVLSVTGGSHAQKDAEMTEGFARYRYQLDNLDQPIWKEVEAVVRRTKPDIVGITVNTCAYKSAENVARLCKTINPEIKIVFGGPHPTIVPDDAIRSPWVDFAVKGEGETPLLNLVRALEAGTTDFSAVSGLVWKNNGAVIDNPRAQGFEDFDALPEPARHLMLDHEKLPAAVFQPVFTSRGCPHRCIFCGSFNIHGFKPRLRSPEKILTEIKNIRRRFSAYNLVFCDDTFGVSRKHSEEILDAIIKEGIDITWVCQTRGETLDEEMLAKMKRAGCHQISLGVETGSPRIRSLIRKGNTNEDILRTARMIKRHGIQLATFFMFGFPTETREDIEQTLAFMKELDPDFALGNLVTPAPGTELFTMARDGNLVQVASDWTNFYHQSPEMFLSDRIDAGDKPALIARIQQTFDAHNARKTRAVFLKWFGLYFKIFFKERMYRQPRYLLSRLKSLL